MSLDGPRSARHAEWVSIHEAALLMGVSPATLRRWSDAGTITAFTTPGGHRRFSRTAISGLLPTSLPPGGDRRQLEHLGARLARSTRHAWRAALVEAPWAASFGDADLPIIAEHGRRLVDGLLAELDVVAEERPEHRRSARRSAAAYGALAARRGVGLRATIDLALRLEALVIREVAAEARRLDLDTAATNRWLETTACTLGDLVAEVMRGHEQLADGSVAGGPTVTVAR